MPSHRFSHGFQGGALVADLGHKALEDLALVIDRAPEVVRDAADLLEDLDEMPAPVGQGAHPLHLLSPDLGG
jgi:hypothetical protein